MAESLGRARHERVVHAQRFGDPRPHELGIVMAGHLGEGLTEDGEAEVRVLGLLVAELD